MLTLTIQNNRNRIESEIQVYRRAGTWQVKGSPAVAETGRANIDLLLPQGPTVAGWVLSPIKKSRVQRQYIITRVRYTGVTFCIGDRIRVVEMGNDPDPIPVGSEGTVRAIWPQPGLGFTQVDVAWDSGRSLMLTVPPDIVEVL